MNLMYQWCTIGVIYVFKIIVIESACYWNTGNEGTECYIYCINESPLSITKKLEDKWNDEDRAHCRENGIWLSLRTLSYPNNIIDSNWFIADVKVVRLDVSFLDVNSISIDAFDSRAFETVKQLEFNNFGLQLIPNGVFNGMEALEILNIKGVKNIRVIEDGVLNSLNELNKFTFEQSLSNNLAININGFTGFEPLAKLEYVQFRYKLTNSISESSFTGLTSVKTLDLSSCQIEFIGKNSFDAISNTIKVLNLSGNKLTTIPSGLFNLMLLKDVVTINVGGNNWNCNCSLVYFRSVLEQFEHKFEGSILCNQPSECMVSILESSCFDECEQPTSIPTTESTSEHTTQPTTALPTTPTTEYFTKHCYKPNESQFSETVLVQRPSKYITITETGSDEVNLNIDGGRDASSVVIWFSENKDSEQVSVEDINCINQGDTTTVPISNLLENVIYSFCLMDKTSTNVSPLDCISYMKRGNQNESVWLSESSKVLTVTLIVLSLLLNIAFGVGIGFWILNYNPFAKTKSDEQSKSSVDSIENIENRKMSNLSRKMSNLTTRSDYTMRTTSTSLQYDTFNFKLPPLPERPSNLRMFEDPVYATVEEVYNEKSD